MAKMQRYQPDTPKPWIHWGALFPFFLVAALLIGFAGTSRAAPGERCPDKPKSVKKTRSLAGRFYGKGMKAFEAGKYEQALSSFRCAQSLLPVRLTRYWIARSAEAAGKHSLAAMLYGELVLAPPPQVGKKELEERLEALKKKMAKEEALRNQPRPREPRWDDPRKHPARPRPGGGTEKKKQSKHASKRRAFTLSGWISIGVGGALTLVGVGLGAAYATDKNKIEDASPGTPWNPDLKKRYDRLDSFKSGTAVCLGVGLGAVVAGSLLLVLRPKERPVSVTVVPTRKGAVAGVQGRF